MARLLDSEDREHDRQLRFELVAPSYRGGGPVPAGAVVRVATAKNSAACGVPPVAGAVYVVFARKDVPSETLRTDTCSGTRMHLAPGSDEANGFDDVPARFVAQQLNGLAGLEVLRAVAASQPDPGDPGNERLVGLLDLAPLAHGGHVRLFAAPDPSAGLLAQVSEYASLESREYAYEQVGAVVYASLPGWYGLRLADGAFAWLPAEDGGTFFPYPALVVDRLNYFTPAWSGFVWPEPGAGLPWRDLRVGHDPAQEIPGQVHEVRSVAGMPFLRVSIYDRSPCADGEAGIRYTGWIPASGRSGDPTAWFYSRGC